MANVKNNGSEVKGNGGLSDAVADAIANNPDAVIALLRQRNATAKPEYDTSVGRRCCRCNRTIPAGKPCVNRGANVLGIECAKHYDTFVANHPGLTDREYAEQVFAAYKQYMAEATAKGQLRKLLS